MNDSSMKILVIRFQMIGDVLLTSVICNSLRKSFPDAQIDYLMYQPAAPLFDIHPSIDRVITVSKRERKSPLGYLKKARSIASADYDIIIDATSTSKSEFISWFSRKAKFRVGRHKKSFGRGLGYTHTVKTDPLTEDKISQRLAMLEPLSKSGLDIKLDRRLQLAIAEPTRSGMRSHMSDCGVDLNRPIFAFAVSSREAEKRWDPNKLLAVAEHCLNHHGAQIILFHGLPHEREDVLEFQQQLNNHEDVFSNIESPSLYDLGVLLSLCDLFVGNEGGPRHIAHAHGVPSAVVFSPSARLPEWLPRGSDCHRGIEWQDVSPDIDTEKEVFAYGDARYFELYQMIPVEAVTQMIDEIVDKHLNNKS